DYYCMIWHNNSWLF
nr:immunoglobulin light chain junction region [Macaca mulatta]